MNEARWSEHDVETMLDFLGAGATSRKLRLFMVACARSVLPFDPDREMTAGLEAAELFADGLIPRRELARARRALSDNHPARVSRWGVLYTDHIRSVPAWHATGEQTIRTVRVGSRTCAWASTRHSFLGHAAMFYPSDELNKQAGWLRDIFGNPFRPVAFDPAWRTEAVVGLARGMYEARDFAPMPVLADALEDAGCADPDVLAHGRGPGSHVRGCWVVNLVLGKA
jgi:hypothetical protein